MERMWLYFHPDSGNPGAGGKANARGRTAGAGYPTDGPRSGGADGNGAGRETGDPDRQQQQQQQQQQEELRQDLMPELGKAEGGTPNPT